MQFVSVQNRQQTHDLTLIGSGANGRFDQGTWDKLKSTTLSKIFAI